MGKILLLLENRFSGRNAGMIRRSDEVIRRVNLVGFG
jgi:hypothetical protein